MSQSEQGVSGDFENIQEGSPAATPDASASAEDTQRRFQEMLDELHKQGVSAPGTVAPASPPEASTAETSATPAPQASTAETSATPATNENTWEREAQQYNENQANSVSQESAAAAPEAEANSAAPEANVAAPVPETNAESQNQVTLLPSENFTLAPIPPTSMESQQNEQASNNVSQVSEELDAAASGVSAPLESTTTVAMPAPPIESTTTVAMPVPTEAAAPAPAPGRSEKQAEADAGQAYWLEQLRQRYSAEFANIPEKFRPKPKAYVARAVFYKPEAEREAYIQEWLQKDREAAEVRQGKRERRTIDVEPIPQESSLRSELVSRGPENTSLSIELARGAEAAISASPLKAQTFKAKERLTHLADRTFDRVVAKAKDPETRRIAKKMVGEFRRQVTLLTREYQVQAKELERAARQAVKVEARKLAGRMGPGAGAATTRRTSRSGSGSTRRRSKQSSRD